MPVGFRLTAGDEVIGEIVLTREQFAFDRTELTLDADTSQAVYDALHNGETVQLELVAGGQIYSTLSGADAGFVGFVDDVILGKLSASANLDSVNGCSDMEPGECFLTTACCSVIGLADDC